jgi:hypothetical protein
MSIKELLRIKRSIAIDGIYSKDGLINIIFNKMELVTYCFKDQKQKREGPSSPLL